MPSPPGRMNRCHQRPSHASQLNAFLGVLRGLGLETGVGGEPAHSTLRVAALRPGRVSGLVLAASSGLLHRAWWQVAAQLPLAMRRGRLNFVPTILADGARAGLPNLIRSSRDLLRDDVTDILPDIVQPTLVIWGENDVLLPPALGEAIAAGIRDSRFVLLPRAGHVLMVDSPLEFNREVLAFLARPTRPYDSGEPS